MARLPLSNITAALANRNYRIYMSGNAVSLVGLWTQRIAVGWLTFDLTQSGAWLGAMAFADLCPSLLVGPVAGAFADRLDRLHVVRVAQVLSMLQAALLAILAAGGWITVELLLALVLLNGVIQGFNQPSRLALVSSLVPRANLSTAVALNSLTFNLARFIGPAAAGLLILNIGVSAAFTVNALTFLAFLLALYNIRLEPGETRSPATQRAGLLAEIGEGLRYVRGHHSIGPLLALALATGVGLRCFVELLPGFTAQVFERGAGGLAALGSAIGVGAMLGGFWLAQAGTSRDLPRLALLHSLGTIVAVLCFAATNHFWAGLAAAVAAGLFMSVSGIAIQTTVQLSAESHVRGRTLSLYGLIMRASPAAGALILGTASEFIGLRAPLAIAAVICFLVWLRLWNRKGRAAPANVRS